jgi:hypothetical protein
MGSSLMALGLTPNTLAYHDTATLKRFYSAGKCSSDAGLVILEH